MDIDWTQIRATVARIENALSKAKKTVEETDADIVQGWPEVARRELEAAFPNWRREYGSDWTHDFLEKKIGRENYRLLRGSRKYRIAPDAYRALGLAQKPLEAKPARAAEDRPEETRRG
jgi:hypothetical protein